MEKCASEMICKTADLTCEGQPSGSGIFRTFWVRIMLSGVPLESLTLDSWPFTLLGIAYGR